MANDFIPYGRQHLDEEDVEAVVRVLRSDRLTQGPVVAEFEEALTEWCGVRYAVAVSSGTAALHVACLAAGVGHGDEVVTSPVTFIASANCACYCGAGTVFTDVEADTGNMDPETLRAAVSENTKAVIPVHLNGLSCDMERIAAVAREARAVVIEDASHAFGGEYRGERVGCCRHADMATVSFHPVKSITTGEGGAVFTNDEAIRDRLRTFREHGIVRDAGRFRGAEAETAGAWYHEMHVLGYNYRITDVQCALGLSQLHKLDRFIERRRDIAARYDELLADIEGILTPATRPYAVSAWHLYAVRLADPARRRVVFDAMRDAGIGVQVHYIPVHLQPYYAERSGHARGDFPRAEAYYDAVLSLPIHYTLTEGEQDRVVETLEAVVA